MESATRVLEQIIEQSPGKRPTDIQMTIIVHGYCLIGDFVKSQDTFNRMSEMGVAPTLETYNTMMYACVLTNKIEEAIKYYTDILNAGLSPDSVTFNILMQCFARRQDEGGAFEVYKSILDSGFAPSSHTVTALTRLLLDGKKYDEATALQDQLFTEYPSTRLSMDPHLVLMRSLSETEKLDEMIRIFYRATETFGLEPTIDTYEVLIRAHAGKDLAGAEKWFKAALDRCPNILHAKLYAAIMLGYRHAKQYEKVKELYEDMKERGVKANVEVYMIMTHISGEQKSRRPGTSGERKKTSY